jgi:hypothetical protein
LKTSFDKIFAASPVDKVAGRVTAKGEGFESKKRIVHTHSEVPLPMKPYAVSRRRPGDVDLTGVRFGRFTVLGVYDHPVDEGQDKGRLWVVRCACGRYTTRRSKAVRNPNNSDDRCDECRQLAYLLRTEKRKFVPHEKRGSEPGDVA